MADHVGVEVHGYPQLAAGTVQLSEHIGQASRDSFLTVADHAATLLRGRLHRDTGATVGSVTSRRTPAGAFLSMGDSVPWAQFEEYGGRGWPHTPTGNFLYPAATSVEPLLVATADKTATTEIKGMRWPTPK